MAEREGYRTTDLGGEEILLSPEHEWVARPTVNARHTIDSSPGPHCVFSGAELVELLTNARASGERATRARLRAELGLED